MGFWQWFQGSENMNFWFEVIPGFKRHEFPILIPKFQTRLQNRDRRNRVTKRAMKIRKIEKTIFLSLQKFPSNHPQICFWTRKVLSLIILPILLHFKLFFKANRFRFKRSKNKFRRKIRIRLVCNRMNTETIFRDVNKLLLNMSKP